MQITPALFVLCRSVTGIRVMNILIYVAPVVYGEMLALSVLCRSAVTLYRPGTLAPLPFERVARDVAISCLSVDLCSLQ
jgi:hypothetical protein